MNEGDLYELAKILGHSDSKDLAIAWKLAQAESKEHLV